MKKINNVSGKGGGEMSKLQHTPGPWLINESDDYTILIRAPWSENVKPEIHDGYGSYLGIHICETRHQGDNPCVSKKTALANARLIAAAPEMLEALIFEAKISQNDICGISIRLIKIIEKATGMSIEEILK
jgi:hypothetical protein